MPEINHVIGIKGSLDDVYATISTIEGLRHWWTIDTTGSSEAGGILRFRFGHPGGPSMKVTEVKKNALVRWTCVEDSGQWVGTEFTFALSEKNGQVTLRFTQAKWLEVTDLLAFCTTKWGVFLMGLKEFVECGTGRPWPHDLQITHQ
jgi:uncharacterized protein YndB with AHSA1/START domain